MALVLLLNLVQNRDKDYEVVWNFIYQVRLVFVSEVVADWIKHAFITKFNGHEPALYARYTLILVLRRARVCVCAVCVCLGGVVRARRPFIRRARAAWHCARAGR
jgi:hypothetical protein